MLTIAQLQSWGADTQDALRRCLNNESFYLSLVRRAMQDASFEALPAAVCGGELDKAFELAHALKGMTANLSLTPVLRPLQEITELLRNKTATDYTPLLEELAAKRQELLRLMD